MIKELKLVPKRKTFMSEVNNINGFKNSPSEGFKTTCCYCGVGCGVVIHKDRNGKLQLEGDKDHPVNKGMLCSKGMNLHYTVMDTSDRLLYPEMRYNKM